MSNRRWNALVIALAFVVLACTLFVVFASFAHGVGAQSAPDPHFTARWASKGVARLSWQQPADVRLTCLSREAAGHVWPIRCWRDLPADTYVLMLGDVGPLDFSAHPQVGDHYLLALDDTMERAELLSVVWLAMVRR
jgi:hypothetical protein